MGQEPSKTNAGQDQQGKINIPYTSFSVPKNQQQIPARKISVGQKPSTPTLTPKKSEGDEIISVVTLDGRGEVKVDETFESGIPEVIDARNNIEKDELLKELSQLPEFYPLIKSKVETTSSPLSNILKFTKKEYFIPSNSTAFSDPSVKDLDSIDTKPVIDICAEFQTYSMHQNRAVALRQEEVLKRLGQTSQKSNNTHKLLVKKHTEIQTVASELRDVERLNRYVDQTKKYLDVVISQIQELESLLPHSVRSAIDNPLFEKCHTVEDDSTNK